MKSKVIKIGNLQIGGDNLIAVQTMWKEKLSFKDIEKAKNQIKNLELMGCDLLRFAVPDIEDAEVVGELAKAVNMPLVADIHFDYKIALRCMDFPIAKIRINPGNIGTKGKTAKVVEKAASKGIPIRIGVNAGSLPSDLKSGYKTAEALVKAAEREIAVFDELGFDNYLVSMKASGIADTIEANRKLAGITCAPIHLGVTEAGPVTAGIPASTLAIAALLKEGIGDTIRVSLSDTMENEIIAAREIIRAAKDFASLEEGACISRLNKRGVNIVSCPRCGRHGFDTHGFTERWMPRLYAIDRDITIAIMGCEVNGPEEARNADLGITGAGDKVLIFKRGKIIKTIDASEADKVFKEELNQIVSDR